MSTCCHTHNAEVKRPISIPGNPLLADPTRTLTLRNAFVADFIRHLNKLKRAIIELVDKEDAFGLRVKTNSLTENQQEQSDDREKRPDQSGTILDHPSSTSSHASFSRLPNRDTCIPTQNRPVENQKEQSYGNNTGTNRTDNQSLGLDQNRHIDANWSNDSQIAHNQQEQDDDRGFPQGVFHRESGGGDDSVSNTGNPHSSRLLNNQRFAFQTEAQQIQSFSLWLSQQIQQDVLTTTLANADDAYYAAYVQQGYEKGAGRAFDQVRVANRAQFAEGSQELAFFNGTREEFLRQSFGRPIAINRVKMLTGRVFTELKGVTDTMAQQMTRVLADGLVQGKNPRVIAREMVGPDSPLKKIGKTRATAIARTEIIRAHAEGQLDTMEQMGVEEVGVMAEWSTAGDDRVCPLCQPLEGTVMKIKEAKGILPRHVSCRCSWVPANVGEDPNKKRTLFFKGKTIQIGQTRSKSGIKKNIDRSIRAEIPKGQKGKRSLAEQKRRTPWPGADKRIASKRPPINED